MQGGSVFHSQAQGGDGFAFLGTVHKLAHYNAALTGADLQQLDEFLTDGVVNAIPVAADDRLVTDEDTAETVDVLSNDTDLHGDRETQRSESTVHLGYHFRFML